MNKTQTKETKLISSEAALILVQEQIITTCAALNIGGNWCLFLDGKQGAFLFKAARGNVKTFRTLEALANQVKKIGLGMFFVRIDNWTPEQGELNARAD